MYRIYMIHWNETEAEKKAEILKKAGYRVDYEQLNPVVLKKLKHNPPDAFLIDLTRLPAQGRDLGVMLRNHGKTRGVPLIFVDGEPQKVERIRGILPDAVYADWSNITHSIKSALRHPPLNPVKTASVFEAYKNRPLAGKLGIKPGATVLLVNAPENFKNLLDPLPAGVKLKKQYRGNADLIIWFVTSKDEVEQKIFTMGARMGEQGIWIAWPKKTAHLKSDLTQTIVRKTGLDAGLVDYKICSIDTTWSGLKFTSRQK